MLCKPMAGTGPDQVVETQSIVASTIVTSPMTGAVFTQNGGASTPPQVCPVAYAIAPRVSAA